MIGRFDDFSVTLRGQSGYRLKGIRGGAAINFDKRSDSQSWSYELWTLDSGLWTLDSGLSLQSKFLFNGIVIGSA